MTRSRDGTNSPFHLLLAGVLLVCLFGLALGSSLDKSPTFDEGFYLARGWAFLKTGRLITIGHPPLANLLSGLGMLLEPHLPAPATLDGWEAGDIDRISRDLLWHRGLNVSRLTFLGRVPIVYVGMLLGALIWRWARESYGLWSGAIALGLFAFSPNILAHTRLATTDLGVAAFYVATLYTWTRFLHRRTTRWLVASGVLFGLAQAAKFSALLLLPTLGIMTLWIAWRTRSVAHQSPNWLMKIDRWPLGWLWGALIALLLMGLIGLLSLWACYLFALQPYPLSGHIAEFRHFLSLATEGHRAYLLGRFSQTGWWYYHPFTLAVKMTLPELLLLALATALAAGRELKPREWEVIFPALLYLGASMFGSLNVGIRYLLPLLPLIFLFISRIASGPLRSGWIRPLVVSALLVAQIASSVWHFPHYLAFFNAAVGVDNGYKLLADSNLDWGQDLPGLAEYLHERGAGQIHLSYFGQADPAYYGIGSIALPGWPPPPPDPARSVFHPMNPAPGLYALSVSNLVGVQLHDLDSFGYFRAREPIARIGHSIHIYEVPPPVIPPGGNQSGPWFAQCAIPEPSEAEAQLARLTGIDNLRHIYFDCNQSLPFPNGPGWILIQANATPVVDLGVPGYLARFADGIPRYQVWARTESPPPPPSTVMFPSVPLPLPIAGHVELLGYRVNESQIRPGETLTLTAWWRVREPPPPPISIFAHLLAPDGTLILAGDGLGVAAQDWQPGMVIVQQHSFPTSQELPPGEYTLAVGIYSLATGERFAVSQSGERVVDRIVLRGIQVLPTRGS